MCAWKTVSVVETIIYFMGCLFLWFRKVDGAGVINNLSNKLISIGVFSQLFLFFLIVQIIWLIIIKVLKHK